MAAYVILANFTDQGIRNVKDTVKRSETFKELAKKKDATVRDIFWTLGSHDIVCIVDAPNEEIRNQPWTCAGHAGQRTHSNSTCVQCCRDG